MSDVLLVNAPVKKLYRHARLSPPLGIGYLASVILQEGYDVAAIDFNISGMNPKRVRLIIEKEAPKVVGISANTQSYLNGLEIARIAKELTPDLPIIMGGPHPTLTYEQTAREQDVQFVVRGEGERTMVELLDSLLHGAVRPSDVEGIAFESDGELTVTGERSFIEDPDDIPFPARELLPLHLYPYPGSVLMSRGGCPFNCRFCSVNNIWKGKRRSRDPQIVVEEVLVLLMDYGIHRIDFVDDTFTLRRDEIIELCQHLRAIQAPFPWEWTCSTRVDLIDRELLREMQEAGCSTVQYGVEAGSQEILDSIGKGITIEQVLDGVRTARELGMEVICSFMFPHPEDTLETIKQQKKLMIQLAHMGAKETLSCTIPYPGTYYFDHTDELGIEILADGWDDFHGGHLVINTRHLSKVQLEEEFGELVRDLGLESA